ncbi:hypothetical protein DYH55_06475 [Methylovirgula sp. 4M-Z18]|nr:hypothetical protein DYH55_06475 [Methylovirgula sp. 4M-Z18]
MGGPNGLANTEPSPAIRHPYIAVRGQRPDGQAEFLRIWFRPKKALDDGIRDQRVIGNGEIKNVLMQHGGISSNQVANSNY